MNFGRILLASAVAFAAGWAASCARPAATSPTKEEQAAAVVRGKSVYDALCAPCHDASDLHLLETPPKLDGLFRKQRLLNGQPVADETVRDVILHGRGIMPPFEHSLTNGDVNDLIQYLHTR